MAPKAFSIDAWSIVASIGLLVPSLMVSSPLTFRLAGGSSILRNIPLDGAVTGRARSTALGPLPSAVPSRRARRRATGSTRYLRVVLVLSGRAQRSPRAAQAGGPSAVEDHGPVAMNEHAVLQVGSDRAGKHDDLEIAAPTP